MTIAKGDRIPDVTLVKATENGPEKVQSVEYFAGKKVALVSVPGAVTPTGSAMHLPGFVEKAGDLKAKGVDEIAATAVNDAFVLGAWNKASGSSDITMLADGNGEFADALCLTMDGSGFGMGKRGQRFSMIVNDGVVEELNVEAPGDFKVSSAEHMLGQLYASAPGNRKGAATGRPFPSAGEPLRLSSITFSPASGASSRWRCRGPCGPTGRPAR